MSGTASLDVSVRSYGAESQVHLHNFAQLVLPLEGALRLDIAGREAVLGRGLAAFVPTGARHEQASHRPNRFLVVDLDTHALSARVVEPLVSRCFLPLAPEALSLIDYMALSLRGGGAVPANRVELWLPLLLETLSGAPPRPASRLGGLLAAMEAAPFAGWSTGGMAARAGLSVSRLHALFREELGATPHGWLARLRLDRVRDWLAGTECPIAELAQRAGFADQSALTRAMRQATGLTPAAYRRKAREARMAEASSGTPPGARRSGP